MSEENRMPLNDQAEEDRLEAAFRAAMHTEQPPAGFAARLEARIAELPQPRQGVTIAEFRNPARPARTPAQAFDRASMRVHLAKAAVLLLAVTVPLGWRLHHRAEEARGEAAKEQVLLAFRITGSQLRSIQERTQSINAGGAPEGDPR